MPLRRSILIALAALMLVGSVAPARAGDDAGALYREGMALKNQGKDDDAIAAFEKAVAADPKHAMAWASLGHLYKKKKDYAKAIDAYEKSLALMPKDEIVWSNLGMAYYRGEGKPLVRKNGIRATRYELSAPGLPTRAQIGDRYLHLHIL